MFKNYNETNKFNSSNHCIFCLAINCIYLKWHFTLEYVEGKQLKKDCKHMTLEKIESFWKSNYIRQVCFNDVECNEYSFRDISFGSSKTIRIGNVFFFIGTVIYNWYPSNNKATLESFSLPPLNTPQKVIFSAKFCLNLGKNQKFIIYYKQKIQKEMS